MKLKFPETSVDVLPLEVPVRFTVARAVEPSKKVTEPVPAATVAVKVTDCVKSDGLSDESMSTFETVTLMVLEVLVR